MKAFITHGGLLSTTEAIYYDVPFIGIPGFGDQAANVALAVREGYGIHLSIKDLNEESISQAITEILRNPV